MREHVRHSTNLTAALAVATALLLAAPAVMAQPTPGDPSGSGVEPLVVEDNPSCADLGWQFGFKIEDDYNRTVPMDASASGTFLTGGAPADPSNSITLSTTDNLYFDWSSTLGIDAVIVKGGADANSFVYFPPAEAYADTALHAPINPQNGQPYGLSHLEFCYDYELAASKTAAAVYYKDIDWTLEKSGPATEDRLAGQAANYGYRVTVTKSETFGPYVVSGTITVSNPTPYTTGFSVTDLVDGVAATVECPSWSLASGESVACTYEASLAGATNGVNTAIVTSLNSDVQGAEATASYTFGAPVLVAGSEPESITVSDTFGPGWSTSSSTSWDYSSPQTCSGNPTDYNEQGFYTRDFDNTATIDQTGDSGTVTVTLNCWAPVVVKTVDTATFNREHQWEIQKDFDKEYQKFLGDTVTHPWKITVTKLDETIDDGYRVTGTITVINNSPLAMDLSSVTDSVGGVGAPVSCPTLTIANNTSLVCTYDSGEDSALDGDEDLNTATAVLNGISFVDTEGFTYEANEINASVDVTDTNGESYQDITATSEFPYDEDFTCSTDPDDYDNGSYVLVTRVNTATITQTNDNDSATVKVTCYAPVVRKDAKGTYDERHTWEIEKSVDPTSQKAFIGDTASWTWTVTVSESSVDENFEVAGSIFVDNPTGAPDSLTVSLADVLDDGTVATVDCGGGATTLTVAPGATGSCSYTAVPADASATLNTATATFRGVGFSATAPVSFSKTVIDGTATVTDDQIGLNETLTAGKGPWTYTDDDSGDCSTEVSLYAGDGTYSFDEDNTATVAGSEGQSDSAEASTTVACYAPLLSKDAAGTYDRRHTWEITKSVTPTSQTGFAGDVLPWTWTVTVSETSADESFAVSGKIYVSNPIDSPGDMTVALTDLLNDGTVATVDCGAGATSLTVAAGASGSCSYTASPSDTGATLNTATGSFNGVDFTATAPVSFALDQVFNGTAVVTDGQIGLNDSVTAGEGPWTYTGDDSHTCSSSSGDYGGDGTYTGSEDNTATVTGSDGQADEDDASTEYTCQMPALAKVIKTTTEGDDDIGVFPFEFTLTDPFGAVVESATLGTGGGTIEFTTDLIDEGTWTVTEILPAGWVSETDLTCDIEIAYPGSAGQTSTCTFDNTEMSRVDLLKLTNGSYNPTKTWSFVLYEGPDGFGGTVVASQSTPTPAEDAGLLRFGDTDLDPAAAYTLCEIEVLAGWSTVWAIDANLNGIIDNEDNIVVPYNPNADDETPADIGNRCVDVGAGSPLPLTPGTTLHLVVDNQYPGGAPRTPGYWKNWNRCTGGGQQYTADANGGWAEGYWLVEDVLDPAIGGGITWDDILSDDFFMPIETCAVAVDILDKRKVGDPDEVGDGKKVASDPLHNLATHLLAAQLNFGAGACTTPDVLFAALEAEQLLDEYDFDGDDHDNLKKNDPDGQYANELAAYLDAYNNGLFCGDGE